MYVGVAEQSAKPTFHEPGVRSLSVYEPLAAVLADAKLSPDCACTQIPSRLPPPVSAVTVPVIEPVAACALAMRPEPSTEPTIASPPTITKKFWGTTVRPRRRRTRMRDAPARIRAAAVTI